MYILRLVEDLFRVWFESISGRFKIYLGFIWGEVSDSFRVRLGLLYFFGGLVFRVYLGLNYIGFPYIYSLSWVSKSRETEKQRSGEKQKNTETDRQGNRIPKN